MDKKEYELFADYMKEKGLEVKIIEGANNIIIHTIERKEENENGNFKQEVTFRDYLADKITGELIR